MMRSLISSFLITKDKYNIAYILIYNLSIMEIINVDNYYKVIVS